jgi:hypothetical protein
MQNPFGLEFINDQVTQVDSKSQNHPKSTMLPCYAVKQKPTMLQLSPCPTTVATVAFGGLMPGTGWRSPEQRSQVPGTLQ